MSKRKHIAAIAREIADALIQAFSLAGLNAGILFCQSKRTNSFYLAIQLLDSSGRRIKNAGAQIRISDHRRPGDRWINYSKPARRIYGVWVYSAPWQIADKIERIVRQIRNRFHRKGGAA